MQQDFNYSTIETKFIDYQSQRLFQITLNREKSLNSLNLTMLNELNDLFDKLKDISTIKAILITGKGKAFCAGADINQLKILDKETGYSFAKSGQEVFNKIESLGKPVIAAINGYCFGGGIELAMACTIRIASSKAIFGQPEIKLGIIPGYGGTQRLTRLIGKSRAMELCLTGENFCAESALLWGLITKIVKPNELLDAGSELQSKLNLMPKHAMHSIISTINEGLNLKLKDALEIEARHFSQLCITQDKNIGVNAFLNKEIAKFE